MKKKIGLFYGSSTCYTEIVAERITQHIGEDRVDRYNVADCDIYDMENYEYLILGIPTWDYGELQEDWEAIWDELDHVNFAQRTVALFGLGDQIGYPQWFLDALGYLHDKVVALGARPIGYWPMAGYNFEESKALTDDGQHFVGLALDEENEFDLSEARITRWCADILSDIDG